MGSDNVDWKALEYARMQAISGVAVRVDGIERALDRIGAMLAGVTSTHWKPISQDWPAWPDENDPRFQKRGGR